MMMEVVRTLRLDLLLKLSLAVLLGGIVGFERELAGKPAGLRTIGSAGTSWAGGLSSRILLWTYAQIRRRRSSGGRG